jgi:hypothetical protein
MFRLSVMFALTLSMLTVFFRNKFCDTRREEVSHVPKHVPFLWLQKQPNI